MAAAAADRASRQSPSPTAASAESGRRPARHRPMPSTSAAGPCCPGLIDAHAHVSSDTERSPGFGPPPPLHGERAAPDASCAGSSSPRRPGRSSAAGITTVRDVGSYDDEAIVLREAIRARPGRGAADPVVRPDHLRATAPGARIFGTMYREADGPWEMRKAVREQIRRGADYIKIMATGARSVEREDPEPAQMTREELAAVVDEAHRMGVPRRGPRRGPRRRPDRDRGGRRHDRARPHRSTARPSSSTGWPSAGSSSSRRCRRSTTSPSASPTTSRRALVDQAKRQADEAHRTLVAAREPPGSPWRWATTAVRPARAPTSSSGWPRRASAPPRRSGRRPPAPRGARPADDRGTIDAGLAADLLVVDGDPLADPAILLDPARIVLVFKDGRIVAGEGAGRRPEIQA